MQKKQASHLDFMKEQDEVQRNRKRLLSGVCANIPSDEDIPSDKIPMYVLLKKYHSKQKDSGKL